MPKAAGLGYNKWKMLKVIRKHIKKLGWPAAILIVCAFVLWGAPRVFRGRGTPTFAGTIFGKKVSLDEYYKSLGTCTWQAKLQYGEKFLQIQKYLNLQEQAWERLILLAKAKRSGLRAADDEVRNSIRTMPLFQTDGDFDTEKYNSLSNPRAFEEETRKTLIISKLVDSVFNEVTVTDEETRSEYEREFAKVRFSYILVESEKLKDQVQVSKEELKDYYEKNQRSFERPIQINVEYLAFDYAEYEGEEQAKNRADEIFYKLIDTPDLAKVSKENSLELKETGYFTINEPIPGIGYAPQFLAEAFKRKPGQISDPLYTAKGCYIIRVKDAKAPYTPSFEEAKDKVSKHLSHLKAWELSKKNAEELQARMKEMLTPDIKFEEVVELLELELKDSGLVSGDDYIAGIGQSRAMVDVALNLKVGEIGPVLKTNKGYAIIRLDKYQPADEDKFKEDLAEFREKILAKKKILTFNQWFSELKQEANLQGNLNPR